MSSHDVDNDYDSDTNTSDGKSQNDEVEDLFGDDNDEDFNNQDDNDENERTTDEDLYNNRDDKDEGTTESTTASKDSETGNGEGQTTKYDAIYTGVLTEKHQSMHTELMISVIKALREDGATSVSFNDKHPLWRIIQDCRSKHAKLIQQVGSRETSCQWYGMPWKEEHSKTSKENKKNAQSKSTMMSRYMKSVKDQLRMEEQAELKEMLTKLNKSRKIYWVNLKSLKEKYIFGKLVSMRADGNCLYRSFLHFWNGKSHPNDETTLLEIRQLIGFIVKFLDNNDKKAVLPFDGNKITIKQHIEDYLQKNTLKVYGIRRDDGPDNGGITLIEEDNSDGLIDMYFSYDEFKWLLHRPQRCFPDAIIVGWILSTLSQVSIYCHTVSDLQNMSVFPKIPLTELSPLNDANGDKITECDFLTRSECMKNRTNAYFIVSNENHVDLFSPDEGAEYECSADETDLSIGLSINFTSESLSALQLSDEATLKSTIMELPIHQLHFSKSFFNNIEGGQSDTKTSLALAMYHSHCLRESDDERETTLESMHAIDIGRFVEFLSEKLMGGSQNLDEEDGTLQHYCTNVIKDLQTPSSSSTR
jgi:hypothetical protein